MPFSKYSKKQKALARVAKPRTKITSADFAKLRKKKKNGKKPTKRRFNKVPKTKKGTPKKYVAGAKNPKAREREIRRTAKLYKEGKLTKAQMDKISKQRSKS